MKEQQVYNILVAFELLDYLLEEPDLRFVQALWALGIADGSDLFYEPSRKTFEKVKLKRSEHSERRLNA